MAKNGKERIDKAVPKNKETSEVESPKGTVLLVRKRYTFAPVNAKLLTAIEMGYFITEPITKPNEVMNVLREAEMPALSQVKLVEKTEGTEVTLTRRHFRERDKKQSGRFESITRIVKNVDEMVALLKKYKFANEQVEIVAGLDEAKGIIEVAKEKKAGRKSRSHK